MTDHIPAVVPSPFQETVRRLAHTLPYISPAKPVASILLRLAGGKQRKAYDVSVFDTQKARLHPFDNISEKRVFITPQFWDPDERQFLENYIRHKQTAEITFLDVGANAGLYSLFARAACSKADKNIRIIAIEPDPVMHARLAHNIEASGAMDETTLLRWAITAAHENVTLHINTKSRGLNRIGEADPQSGGQTVDVEGHPLTDIFDTSDIEKIDILKIDIEGAEHPALAAFFETAEEWQRPENILIEISHEEGEKSAFKLCLENGYQIAFSNNLNAVLTKE